MRDTRKIGEGQLRALSGSFKRRLGPQPRVRFPEGSMGADLLGKRKRIEKTEFRDRKVLFEIATVTFEDGIPTIRPRNPDR